MFWGNGAGKSTGRSDYGANIGIGIESLKSLTTGKENTAFGYQNLYSVTTGIRNSAMGSLALLHLTTGSGNAAIGYAALGYLTTGSNNLAIGGSASIYLGGASSDNVAMGAAALLGNGSLPEVSRNVAVGSGALGGPIQTGADQNTSIGFQSGYAVTTGAHNVLLGYRAGNTLTTGSDNIIIGYNAVAPSITASNQLNIGNTLYGNLSTGFIGIGTSTPGAKLDVYGNSNIGTNYANYLVLSGSTTSPTITADGSGTNIDLKIAPKGYGQTIFGGGGWTYNTQSSGAGSILFNNGSSDSPNIKFAYANNRNFGLDAQGNTLRFIRDSDESGGAVMASFDQSSNLTLNGSLSVSSGINSLANSQAAGEARFNIQSNDYTSYGLGVGGGILFSGKYNSAGIVTAQASIQGAKENATDGNYAASLVFTTRAQGSSPTEKMRITSSGNVGIGTSNPLATLHLYKDSLPNVGSLLLDQPTAPTGSTNLGPHFFMKSAGVDRGWIGFFDNSTHGNGTTLNLKSAGEVRIGAGGFADAGDMIITTAGKVGIGTTAPSDTLHVVGNGRFMTGANAGYITTYAIRSTGGWQPISMNHGSPDLNLVYDTANGNVKGNLNVGNGNLYVKSTGEVGIGTDTPTSKLTVGSGQLELPLGSVSAPSMTFTGDLDTGFYLNSGSLSFTKDGARQFYLDAAQGFVLERTGGVYPRRDLVTYTSGGHEFTTGRTPENKQFFGFGDAYGGGTAGFHRSTTSDGTVEFRTQNYSNADFQITLSNPANSFNIKGAASQTANLTEWKNSAGTVIGGVDYQGGAFIGSASHNIGSPHIVGLSVLSPAPAGAGANNYAGYFKQPYSDVSRSIGLYTESYGSINTTGYAVGLEGRGYGVSGTSTGTLPSLSGLNFNAFHYGTSLTNVLTITNLYGMNLNSGFYNGGSNGVITNAYGVKGAVSFGYATGGVTQTINTGYGGYFDVGVGNGYTAETTMANMYGVYISTKPITGNTTNRFGLYVTDASGSSAATNDYGLYINSGLKNYIKGDFGIGTNAPTAQLHTTGTVRFASLTGAGASLIVDANGNVTVSSDERLKNIQNTFDRGLTDLEKINPIVFKWKPETGYDTENAYAGFSAQNIQLAIPEAVSTDSRGFLTLADRPILATVVNAVKQIGSVFVKIENGVAYFTEIVVNKFTTKEICLEDETGKTCITKTQLDQILLNNGSVQSSGGNSASTSNNSTPNSVTNYASSNETTSTATSTSPTTSNPISTSTTEIISESTNEDISTSAETENISEPVSEPEAIVEPVVENVPEPAADISTPEEPVIIETNP
jgi:hypothetical protein